MLIDTPCVIFAGGKSSRMGEDKSLLPFGAFNTLSEFQLSKLSQLFTNVYISTKDKNKFDFDANFIEDVPTQNIFAPTAGFVAIFQALKCERFFALSVDAPFIKEETIHALLQEDSKEVDATIAKSPFGMEPMCGIYHHSLQNDFEMMLEQDNHKLGYLLKNSHTKFVEFSDEKQFFNLNHPHEYQEALKRI